MSDLPKFAHLLRIHLDRNGRSPDWLAQQLQLSPEIVSAWLSGSDHPPDRETVIQVIGLLSIDDPREQQVLLRAAGYPSSQRSIINQTNFYGSVSGPIHTGSGDIRIENPLSLTALKDWLRHFFRWRESPEHMQSSWAGVATWGLKVLADRFTPGGWLTLSLALALWIITALAVTPFYQWPFADNETRLLACLQFAAATITVPLLVAIATRPDYDALFIRDTQWQRLTLLLLKATGALVGFGTFAGMLLFVAMAVYYVTLGSLPAWLWWLLAAVPLLWSHIAARRIPADRYKMFGPKPQLHEADKLFFTFFLFFGPFLAGFVYLSYAILAQRIMGFAILLLIIGVALWEQRKRAPAFLSEAATVLIVGLTLPALVLLLFVFFSDQFDTVPLSHLDSYLLLFLALLYVLAPITVSVTLFLRNRPNLTLPGASGFLAVLLLLNGILAIDLTIGRWLTIAVVILWILWGRKRFRHLLWVHTSFPLMLIAIGVSFYLAAVTVVPIWANILGFVLVTAALVLWAYRSPRLGA